MHRLTQVNSAQALYRVFVAPAISRPCLPLIAHQRSIDISPRSSYLQGQSRRHYAKKPPTMVQRAPRDEEIPAQFVHLVSPDGKLQPPVPLHRVLSSFDRTTNFLVQVGPATDQQAVICKILSKQDLRDAERAKLKPRRNSHNTVKQLELNWAIDANDLEHRLKRMKEFLEKGMRVEVMLAAKRRGRVATRLEAEAVLKSLYKTLGEVEGAREWKGMEGKVLGTVTLFFEGRARSQ